MNLHGEVDKVIVVINGNVRVELEVCFPLYTK